MKKYLNITSGFVRFKNGIELNWSLLEWAFLFSIEYNEFIIFIRFLCISIILPNNIKEYFKRKQSLT